MTLRTPDASPVERVRAGARWLDENYEGWRDRVAVNELDMVNPCHCVLGQLFEPQARQVGYTSLMEDRGAGFIWAVNSPYQVLTSGKARALGFDRYEHTDTDWERLAILWRQVLKGVPLEELSLKEDPA